MVNICDPFDKSTYPRYRLLTLAPVFFDYFSCECGIRCRAVAERFLSERNGQAQHTIHAMGHCHIDSGMTHISSDNSVRASGLLQLGYGHTLNL